MIRQRWLLIPGVSISLKEVIQSYKSYACVFCVKRHVVSDNLNLPIIPFNRWQIQCQRLSSPNIKARTYWPWYPGGNYQRLDSQCHAPSGTKPNTVTVSSHLIGSRTNHCVLFVSYITVFVPCRSFVMQATLTSIIVM